MQKLKNRFGRNVIWREHNVMRPNIETLRRLLVAKIDFESLTLAHTRVEYFLFLVNFTFPWSAETSTHSETIHDAHKLYLLDIIVLPNVLYSLAISNYAFALRASVSAAVEFDCCERKLHFIVPNQFHIFSHARMENGKSVTTPRICRYIEIMESLPIASLCVITPNQPKQLTEAHTRR